MLFGCLPIQNIPVFLVMYSALAVCLWTVWECHKDERHRKGIERVRRCETHRRAMYFVEQSRKSRAERMKAYYKN